MSYTVVLDPPIGERLIDEGDCRHPLGARLFIGCRTVRDGGGGTAPASDAILCLCCGTVGENQAFDDWYQALGAAWREFGWHRRIGGRLSEMAAAATSTRAEAFYALTRGEAPYNPADRKR